MALKYYFLTSASECQLTTPDDVHEAIRGLKVSKSPGPNGVPNRAVNHLHKRSVSLIAHVLNAVLRTHHFPQAWKNARVITILTSAREPTLSSSYRPISFFEEFGKIFEMILLARNLHVVSKWRLIRDEQFGFRPRHITSLQLTRLVERITRNFVEKCSQAHFSSTLPKPSIPFASMASSTC